ncbi:nucleotidyltransferase [Ruegeria sp. Ofav3-42]|uniref:nucleotidyltransferase n=1 Tax=Ruegeria sp. Ofav3-42 TaxID=2917759 RepID=UPI001EF5C571|nr:nucleotidyltransferase [Ruegeria sp. Ofav3-42]MCG7521513.1 nucleotidyltransferase [Ruegeria sp. Ofav3-42]
MNDHISRQSAALGWIVGLFEKHLISYQVVGGLAVLAYGGTRPLNDIDVYIDFSQASDAFFEEIRETITWGPEAIKELGWDLTYLKANFRGQKLEIADSGTKTRIQNRSTGEWVELPIDYESSVRRNVLGYEILVMPASQLSAYKTVLGRPFDKQDVYELQSHH